MSKTNAKRFSLVMKQLAKVPSQSSAAISRGISKEIMRSMDASVDPDGRAWKLKADGSRSKLRKTGAGRRSIKVTPSSGAGIQIIVHLLYMIYHQFGGKSHLRGHKKHKDFGRNKDRGGSRNNPPKRSYLPFDTMPKRWLAIVSAEMQKQAQKVIDRG